MVKMQGFRPRNAKSRKLFANLGMRTAAIHVGAEIVRSTAIYLVVVDHRSDEVASFNDLCPNPGYY